MHFLPEDVHPRHREAATRVLHPDGGCDEVTLVLSYLGVLDGVLGGQQLPRNAPH